MANFTPAEEAGYVVVLSWTRQPWTIGLYSIVGWLCSDDPERVRAVYLDPHRGTQIANPDDMLDDDPVVGFVRDTDLDLAAIDAGALVEDYIRRCSLGPEPGEPDEHYHLNIDSAQESEILQVSRDAAGELVFTHRGQIERTPIPEAIASGMGDSDDMEDP